MIKLYDLLLTLAGTRRTSEKAESGARRMVQG